MLRMADQHCPGLADRVVWSELSPLSLEHFTAHPRGAIYGLPMSRERMELEGFGVQRNPVAAPPVVTEPWLATPPAPPAELLDAVA